MSSNVTKQAAVSQTHSSVTVTMTVATGLTKQRTAVSDISTYLGLTVVLSGGNCRLTDTVGFLS